MAVLNSKGGSISTLEMLVKGTGKVPLLAWIITVPVCIEMEVILPS
jgi:hypothetical protein